MRVLNIGQGEIGKPFTLLLQELGITVYAKDVEPLKVDDHIDVMLINIPFKEKQSFVKIVSDYIIEYQPSITIVHSTVLPDTCALIKQRLLSQCDQEIKIAHSPVMGRHRKEQPSLMFEDIKAYPKFIGADTELEFTLAQEFYTKIGLVSKRLTSTNASEVAKLLETTYSGILIGWMQEVEHICKQYGVDYKETLQLIDAANKRIEFQRPTTVYPGFIGGHCIGPNIDLLLQEIKSDYLTAVVNSNERKRKELEKDKQS